MNVCASTWDVNSSGFLLKANMCSSTSIHSPYAENLALAPQEAAGLFPWSVALIMMTSWFKTTDGCLYELDQRRGRGRKSPFIRWQLMEINPAVLFSWRFWCSRLGKSSTCYGTILSLSTSMTDSSLLLTPIYDFCYLITSLPSCLLLSLTSRDITGN